MSVTTKFNVQFLRHIALALVSVGALGSYPLWKYASEEILEGVFAGVVLSVVNVLLGYAAIEYSSTQSYSRFVQIMLGGIAVRLFVIAGSLLVLIVFVNVHPIALVVSLFTMYVIFLAIEVLYIHTAWQNKTDVQNLK